MHGSRYAVAFALLLACWFAACSDALLTGPRVAGPRLDTAMPLANVATDPAPIIVAAGDVAQCTSLGDEATALLLDSLQFDAVLALGDLAYEDATAIEFQNCYDPTWGRHKAKTRPTPGNHEYHTPNAAGYFSYFGAAATPTGGGQTYYSFNLGEWHILSLDSNLPATSGSAQLTWIRQDLAANPKACSLAYWHHPMFSSGIHGNVVLMRDAWRVLDSAGVDVVLVGHDHTYERFAPQTSTGIAIPTGIRQFVVGTGGSRLRSFSTVRANSEQRSSDTWGVLKLILNPTSYDWEFVPVAGRTFTDQGTAGCVQTAPPEANQQPVASLTTPANGATFTAPATITLEATASDADGNLNRVEFYRGSTFIGSDATAPYSLTWTNAEAGSYNLTARAVDAAEAWAASTTVRVTVTPPPNSAPTVSLTAPLDDANFTAPATMTLEASAADVDGNLSRVEFYEGTTLLGTATASPYSFTWRDVPAGNYTLTARAVDAADAATTSNAVGVTVEALPATNSPPTVSLTGPAGGATFTAPATITLEAGAADVDGNLSRVEFYHGTTLLGSDATSPYSFSWTNAPAGSYTLTARAVDAADATRTSAAVQITVNAPPAANSGGPYAGSEGVALTVNGSASTDPENAALTYRWDFGDGTIGAGAAPSKAYADNGTYTITLVVSDPSGASHSATTTATIANVPPTGTFSAPSTAASSVAYTLAITGGSDVPADQSGLQYQFDCGAGLGAWGAASSTSCPGVTGPATRTVRGALRDKDGGVRQLSANVDILAPPGAYFLVLDQGAIARSTAPNNFTSSDINRDLSDYTTRRELRWFAANAGRSITLFSGSVGSEGFHALKTIPASWSTAGPTADGLRNYLLAGPGLGSQDASGNRQTLLGTVPDVTPLRATGLRMLVRQPVCAVVRDGDVSISYGPLRASLQGRYLGIVAFVVDAVTPRNSGSALPEVRITVSDADAVCAGALQRLMAAPAPISSSNPPDTGP